MGGAVSCILASMFPEMIKELVLIENLGPFSYLEEDFSKKLKTHIVQTHRLLSKSMPEYETVEQAEQARQRGTAKGTLSKRGAYLLVSRGLVDAKTKSIGPWQTDLKQIWTWRYTYIVFYVYSLKLTERTKN